jgi:hypothetical protein
MGRLSVESEASANAEDVVDRSKSGEIGAIEVDG